MFQNRVLAHLMGSVILVGGLALSTIAQAKPNFTSTFVVTNTADSGPGSLRQALESANASSGADTIVFEVDGTVMLASPLPIISEDVEIDGSGHAITIDGAGAYRIFEVPAAISLRIVQLELVNSNGLAEGGAILNAGWLEVQQCKFQSNTSLSGGAIYSSGTLIVGGGTRFISNTAEKGGGIYTSGDLSIENASFDGNYADGFEGGGIYTTAPGARLQAVTFTNNVAVNEGGAVYNLGTLTILDSEFDNNQSWKGAVTSVGGELAIQTGRFTNNIANMDGGAVYANGLLEISGGYFTGNQATQGGAVWIMAGSSGTIRDATFEGNMAADNGGAIQNSGSLNLEGVSLSENAAGLNGGGIMNLGSLNMLESTISNIITYDSLNDASFGGGIYNTGEAYLEKITLDHIQAIYGPGIHNSGSMQVVDSTIKENQGEFSGAIYNSGELSIQDSRLNNNQAGSEGGAIDNRGHMQLLRTTLSENEGSDGGAIVNQGDLEIQDSLFEENTADLDQGGAIYNLTGNLQIQNTDFVSNFAPNGGGVIFNRGSLQITGGRFSDNSSKWGGAIYSFNAQPSVIHGATFEHNIGGHWGGAILTNSTMEVHDSIFNANEGYEFSGGIVNGGDLLVRGSTFTRNISHLGGGGALSNTGNVTIETSTFFSNTASTQGGAISNNGSRASLTLNNSSLEDNRAQEGGAIFNSGELYITSAPILKNGAETLGGGIYNAGILEVTDSQLNENGTPLFYSDEGGGLYNALNASARFTRCTLNDNFAWLHGGAIANYGALEVGQSNFSSNKALDSGGAIFSTGSVTILDTTLDKSDTWNYGGTIYMYGTMEILHSTITGSYSWSGGTILSGGHLKIENSTISGNYGDYEGSAVLNFGTASINYSTIAFNYDGSEFAGSTIDNRGTLEIGHSIIASPGGHRNCLGTLISTGPNLSDDDSCTGFIVADPQLSPLGDYGGLTWTHALLPGSPAVDTASDPSCPWTDQRGELRPQGLSCDLGAFEAHQVLIRIDIRPLTQANVIDLRHPGTLPVAILSSPAFNAPVQISLPSLTFGASGWEVPPLVSQSTGKILCQKRDVNGDRLPDLDCTFPISGANFTCSSQQGLLRGLLNDSTWIVGADLVRPRPCP